MSSARPSGHTRGPRGGFKGFRSSRASFGRGFPDQNTGPRKAAEMQPTPPPPYGELLLEIERKAIPKSTYEPKIRDCSYVASYNWLDSANPTIVIPGKPPVWRPPLIKRRLEQDSGEYFRDPNAARFPDHPLEPSVRAVFKQNVDFDTDNVDIFTCASVLGNLSRFVRGADKDFRFIMEKVGKTVFFTRRENSPTELIPNVRGYGHTFPEEYTSWGSEVKGSVSSQRIIQYVFGGLRILVRFEVDGYLDKPQEERRHSPTLDSLMGTLGKASISQAKPNTEKKLQIEERGKPIPQRDVLDIKTRSVFDFKTRTITKEIDMTDIVPRLWVSQIPTLVVAFHDRGVFEDVQVRDMRDEVAQWEKDNEGNLRQLASLLGDLIEFAVSSSSDLEACREQSGPLQIRRVATRGRGTIPVDLKVMWSGEDKNL